MVYCVMKYVGRDMWENGLTQSHIVNDMLNQITQMLVNLNVSTSSVFAVNIAEDYEEDTGLYNVSMTARVRDVVEVKLGRPAPFTTE